MSVVGHPLQILNMALSADGTRLATSSLDRTASVWDARSGRELLTLAGHQAAIDQVAFSPDGQRLATASRDGTARVWDLGPSREALTLITGVGRSNVLREDGPQAGQVALSHDTSRLLAGFDDGSASVWDTRTGVEALSLSGNQGKVWAAAISRDGSRLATGGSNGTVDVWDAGTGGLLWTGTAHRDCVVAVAFSPDGTQLASAGADGTAQLWNSATGQNMHTFTGRAGPLTRIAFNPDGMRLATASQASGDPIRIWDVQTGDVVNVLTGHDDAIWSVAFSPDGTRLVSASRDGTARIWDVSRGASTLTLFGHRTLVGARFSPDGQRVATGDRDGLVQLWDAETGREVLELTGAAVGEGIDSLAFSSDGRYLAVRGDQAVRLYVMPIEDLTALVRSRLSRWWTPEECRRFLNLEDCPGNPLRARSETSADTANALRQRQVDRPAAPAPIVGLGLNASSAIKIVSSLPHGGIDKERTDSILNAFKMALGEHNYRVAGTTVSYADIDDALLTGNSGLNPPSSFRWPICVSAPQREYSSSGSGCPIRFISSLRLGAQTCSRPAPPDPVS